MLALIPSTEKRVVQTRLCFYFPRVIPARPTSFATSCHALADRWRLIAPDYPGAGYSGTPDNFNYSFGGYADFLDSFVKALSINRFALYLHDFGSPVGARLAIKAPDRVVALITQNADIPYEDALGPKYAEIEKTWTLPVSEMREKLAEAINEETFREEFLNDVRPELAACIPPDLWKLHWSLMTPRRKEIASASSRAYERTAPGSRSTLIPQRTPATDAMLSR